MARKSKSEREQKRAADKVRVWRDFQLQLVALESFGDAQELVKMAPREGSPGRAFYSNLGFFLTNFIVPDGSSYKEKALYLEFIRRIDAKNQLKSGVGQRVENDLRRAMEAQGDF